MNAQAGSRVPTRVTYGFQREGRLRDTQYGLLRELPSLVRRARADARQPAAFITIEPNVFETLKATRVATFQSLQDHSRQYGAFHEGHVVSRLLRDPGNEIKGRTLDHFTLGYGQKAEESLAVKLEHIFNEKVADWSQSPAAAMNRLSPILSLMQYLHAIDVSVVFVNPQEAGQDLLVFGDRQYADATQRILKEQWSDTQDAVLYAREGMHTPESLVRDYLQRHSGVEPVFFIGSDPRDTAAYANLAAPSDIPIVHIAGNRPPGSLPLDELTSTLWTNVIPSDTSVLSAVLGRGPWTIPNYPAPDYYRAEPNADGVRLAAGLPREREPYWRETLAATAATLMGTAGYLGDKIMNHTPHGDLSETTGIALALGGAGAAYCAWAIGRAAQEMMLSRRKIGLFAVSDGTRISVTPSWKKALFLGILQRTIGGPLTTLLAHSRMSAQYEPIPLERFDLEQGLCGERVVTNIAGMRDHSVCRDNDRLLTGTFWCFA